MIPNGEGCHYLAVKKLSALSREITSKHHGDFYCRKCLHSFATKNKQESDKKVCKNKDFCDISMSSEDTEMLKFNQYWNSDQVLVIIYADLECSREKTDRCKNNSENSSTAEVREHIPPFLEYHHLKT